MQKVAVKEKEQNYSSRDRTRRVKLQQGKLSLDIREIFLAVKIVQRRNQLPGESGISITGVFKNRLAN